MNYFKTVKRYYDKGLYTVDQVAVFVEAGKITTGEFEQITGITYAEYQEGLLAKAMLDLTVKGVDVNGLL